MKKNRYLTDAELRANSRTYRHAQLFRPYEEVEVYEDDSVSWVDVIKYAVLGAVCVYALILGANVLFCLGGR